MSVFQRVKACDLLTVAELETVRHPSDLWGLWCVLHAWGVIALAMVATAYVPWIAPIALISIGSRQLGLAILMHDAAHGILARGNGLNNFLGQYLCAAPVFSDLKPYRVYHLLHHRRTQQPDDPDLALSAPFPVTRASFRRKLVRDMTGQTAYQQRKAQFAGAAKRGLVGFLNKMWPALLVNALILAGCIAAGFWWLYPALWLLPLATWFQLVVRVRNIAEHAIVPDNNDPFRNARTVSANLAERMILAPYWVNYHVEHHLLFWVPCYRLPRLHALLIAKGFGPRMELRPSYADIISDATSRAHSIGGNSGARERRRNAVFEGHQPEPRPDHAPDQSSGENKKNA